jgi:hypothetical protein
MGSPPPLTLTHAHAVVLPDGIRFGLLKPRCRWFSFALSDLYLSHILVKSLQRKVTIENI